MLIIDTLQIQSEQPVQGNARKNTCAIQGRGKIFAKLYAVLSKKNVSNVAISRFLVAFFGPFWKFMEIFIFFALF